MHFADDGNIYSVAEHAGVSAAELLDFSANVHPFTLPESAAQAWRDGLAGVGRYPDPDARGLCKRAAEHYGVPAENILAGNGATEFIYAIPRAHRPRRALLVAPCYHDYWRALDRVGADVEGVLATEETEFVPDLTQVAPRLNGVNLVFFGNPNNPTGVTLPADPLRSLAEKAPGTLFVIDETYAEFVPEAGGASMLGKELPRNVIVLRSLSPFYCVPGVRLGFMIGDAEMCRQIHRLREPWTVSGPAQALGEALLSGECGVAALREEVITERERLRDALSRMTGLRVFHSQANFLLVKVTRPSLTSLKLCERLLTQKALIRNAAGFRGLDGKYVRISVRSASDTDRLIDAMKLALDESKWK